MESISVSALHIPKGGSLTIWTNKDMIIRLHDFIQLYSKRCALGLILADFLVLVYVWILSICTVRLSWCFCNAISRNISFHLSVIYSLKLLALEDHLMGMGTVRIIIDSDFRFFFWNKRTEEVVRNFSIYSCPARIANLFPSVYSCTCLQFSWPFSWQHFDQYLFLWRWST